MKDHSEPYGRPDPAVKYKVQLPLLRLHYRGLAYAGCSFALLVLSTFLRERQWIDSGLSKTIGLLAGASLLIGALSSRVIGNYRLLGKRATPGSIRTGRRIILGLTIWLILLVAMLIGGVIAHVSTVHARGG